MLYDDTYICLHKLINYYEYKLYLVRIIRLTFLYLSMFYYVYNIEQGVFVCPNIQQDITLNICLLIFK